MKKGTLKVLAVILVVFLVGVTCVFINEGLSKKLSGNLTQISNKQSLIKYIKVNKDFIDVSKEPYNYTVGYSVVKVDIEVGLVSDEYESNVYGGRTLALGSNNITIIVTDKEGQRYTYNLFINRKETSDYLNSLYVKDYDLDFEKTKQDYELKVNNSVSKLDVVATPEDENAVVTIKGNKKIKNKDKVTIEVKSKDNTVRVYTIKINKPGILDVRLLIILIMVLTILSGVFKYIRFSRENNA